MSTKPHTHITCTYHWFLGGNGLHFILFTRVLNDELTLLAKVVEYVPLASLLCVRIYVAALMHWFCRKCNQLRWLQSSSRAGMASRSLGGTPVPLYIDNQIKHKVWLDAPRGGWRRRLGRAAEARTGDTHEPCAPWETQMHITKHLTNALPQQPQQLSLLSNSAGKYSHVARL